jgi:hypothetical protein
VKQAGGLPLGAFIGIGCFGLLIVCAVLAAMIYRHRAVDSYSAEAQEATDSTTSFTGIQEPMSMVSPLTNDVFGFRDIFDDRAGTEVVSAASPVIWDE